MILRTAVLRVPVYYYTLHSLILCSLVATLARARTETFELEQLCKGQFPPKMHRKIDGAVIISRNEKNLDCHVTFTTEYVSQHFLIRFEEFNMECEDTLQIFDSENPIGNPRADLNCRYLRPEDIGIIKTRGHYVTLKFIADNWGISTRRFTMVLTAYKDASQGCRDAFLCSPENMCISNTLLCDNVNNCNNGMDERANCTSNFLLDLFASASGNSSLGIIIISGLVLVSIVIGLCCVICYLRARERPPPNWRTGGGRAAANNHTKARNNAGGRTTGGASAGSNGTGVMITLNDSKTRLHALQHPHQSTTLDSLGSGNLHLPAESQGIINTSFIMTRLHYSITHKIPHSLPQLLHRLLCSTMAN